MVNVNGQSGFEPEPLPAGFEAELLEVDTHLSALLTRVETPAGLEDRIFAASVQDLPTTQPIPLSASSHAHVFRSRWLRSGRLAMAASLALVCVIGSWMLRNRPQNVAVDTGSGGPSKTLAVGADSELNGAIMLASLESMSTDSVATLDGGWLWSDYERQEMSVNDLTEELSAMMQALGSGDEM